MSSALVRMSAVKSLEEGVPLWTRRLQNRDRGLLGGLGQFRLLEELLAV